MRDRCKWLGTLYIHECSRVKGAGAGTICTTGTTTKRGYYAGHNRLHNEFITGCSLGYPKGWERKLLQGLVMFWGFHALPGLKVFNSYNWWYVNVLSWRPVFILVTAIIGSIGILTRQQSFMADVIVAAWMNGGHRIKQRLEFSQNKGGIRMEGKHDFLMIFHTKNFKFTFLTFLANHVSRSLHHVFMDFDLILTCFQFVSYWMGGYKVWGWDRNMVLFGRGEQGGLGTMKQDLRHQQHTMTTNLRRLKITQMDNVDSMIVGIEDLSCRTAAWKGCKQCWPATSYWFEFSPTNTTMFISTATSSWCTYPSCRMQNGRL